jgi:hypothetical protein
VRTGTRGMAARGETPVCRASTRACTRMPWIALLTLALTRIASWHLDVQDLITATDPDAARHADS